MQQLSYGIEHEIKRYFLSHHQPEWWAENHGDTLSLSELIEKIKTDYPDDVPAVAKLITQRLASVAEKVDGDDEQRIFKAASPDDPFDGLPYAEIRRRQAKASNRDFNVTQPTSIDPGVPAGPERFENLKDRPEFPDVSSARDKVSIWAIGTDVGSLLLAGSPGVGKTHLALAAARVLLERDQEIVYRQETALISDIRARFSSGTADDLIDVFSTVKWLVLDDMGQASLTSTYAAIVDQIIDARWRGAPALNTLVTTNLLSGDMSPRIASRLGDVSRGSAVMIKAEDYRRSGE